jgi:Ni/Fe-hydrogenase 1 B-type cytochrome subunit
VPSNSHPEYHEYLAGDAPTRWFHWINALAVIGLMATGIVILNDDSLGISAAGKVLQRAYMSHSATS